MDLEVNSPHPRRFEWLNVYVARLGQSWLLQVRPTGLPLSLGQCFDQHLEARATALDFEDLDQFMLAHDAAYEKRVATTGGVELTARGESAHLLGRWLTSALASGVRDHA